MTTMRHRYRDKPHQSGRAAVRRALTRVLCALGTLAHNRSFTREDVRSYVYVEGIGPSIVSRALDNFVKKGWLTRVEPRGHLYPTKKGWRAIQIACRTPAGHRGTF